MMTFLIINVVLVNVLVLGFLGLFWAAWRITSANRNERNAKLDEIDNIIKKSQSLLDSMSEMLGETKDKQSLSTPHH
jgi:hypothetical protein